ncbi:1-aminocyclopropane-1-carboxylate deaminase/D-cysteine desulfhydrase [Aureibaculum marinum]|uniref:1-aminocyclopropane-1-carboxylate deaminase/D-cysteine desulfhydrase n=1 Tax=Aureibaculum marinum TaxID=2487930 RepID=A0A3N4P8Q0_9FLAO|nr:pyridoxal-phosphate dependent enzyme [Aureibaculum marinum]RPE00090.1 1-aminocyclopropane-1-carboxylate deaminase/D-cysteine desulfhydrase [Aureibaculum marinum]
MNFKINSRNQTVQFHLLNDIEVVIKREDEIHPHISGNKYRKLKYNIIAAKNQGINTLLTFGGAYSNHIAATAAAGAEFGFKTIGIIRGEEIVTKIDENPTLSFAQNCGMKFKFITRSLYREKENSAFIESLKKEFGTFYRLPEGGTNELAIRGCEEILTIEDKSFDYICTAVGTGGTIAGIINSAYPHQKVIGFPSLKGDFLHDEIAKWTTKTNWELETNYHFGGYGKINNNLITFINKFKEKTSIPLDPIYTGKMLYGIVDMIQNLTFDKGSKILAIHTGGLQGIEGMNKLLKQKKTLQII